MTNVMSESERLLVGADNEDSFLPYDVTDNGSIMPASSQSSTLCVDASNSDMQFILGGIYIILVSVGLLGNAIVIAMILRVICNKGLLTNVYIYIVCLSMVDFTYLATGPFIIYYFMTGTWIFGSVVCRIVYIFEGLNKTMSIYLLVILSGDRYLAACRPTTSARYRSVKAAVVAFLFLTAAITLTNIPIYLYSEVKSMPHNPTCYQCGIYFPMISQLSGASLRHFPAPDNYNNVSFNNFSEASITLINLPNATSSFFFEPVNPWANLGSYYTLFLIIVYYLLPTLLILAFYAKIMTRLHQQYRLVRKKSSKRNRVTKSVLAVISFYFICWTPYWILQSISIFWPSLGENPDFVNVFIYLATSIYTLPYVHACIDPILYAFLNKHLWVAYAASTRRRMHRNGKLPDNSYVDSGVGDLYQMEDNLINKTKLSLMTRCSGSLRAWLEHRPANSSTYEEMENGNHDEKDAPVSNESFGSRKPILQHTVV